MMTTDEMNEIVQKATKTLAILRHQRTRLIEEIERIGLTQDQKVRLRMAITELPPPVRK